MKTYVLAGDDRSNAFKDELDVYEQSENFEVIRPTPGQSIEEAMTQIKPPANVILATHGEKDGTFTWNKHESLEYGDLFSALPREGISSIAINGCYGGTAQDMLADVPKGTLLLSMVGKDVMSTGRFGTQFARELVDKKEITRTSILLESLDNVSPEILDRQFKVYNAFQTVKGAVGLRAHREEVDPNKVLPHTIGIGGNPPTELNLDTKMAELAEKGGANAIDPQQFEKAKEMVREHFDGNYGSPLNRAIHGTNQTTGLHLGEGDLVNDIDLVANTLERGGDTTQFTLQQKRIGYALTIANMDTSGELDRLVAQARGETVAPVLQAEQAPPAPIVEQETPATKTPTPEQVGSKGPTIIAHTRYNQADYDNLTPDPTLPDRPPQAAQETTASAPSSPEAATPQPTATPETMAPAAPALTRDERIAKANEDFGVPSREDLKVLQRAMHHMGEDLGPHGSKDENGNCIGDDGIKGPYTQNAWMNSQREAGIPENEISEKYNEANAAKIIALSEERMQAQSHEAAPDAPAPNTPAVSSWMGEVPSFQQPEAAMCREDGYEIPSDWQQSMSAETVQSVQQQLAETRGDNMSHDVEQGSSAQGVAQALAKGAGASR